jgi:hypothetical protein
MKFWVKKTGYNGESFRVHEWCKKDGKLHISTEVAMAFEDDNTPLQPISQEDAL